MVHVDHSLRITNPLPLSDCMDAFGLLEIGHSLRITNFLTSEICILPTIPPVP